HIRNLPRHQSNCPPVNRPEHPTAIVNIDPPASSYAIMRRAGPYRGENSGPGKDIKGELDPNPRIREQNLPQTDIATPCSGLRFHRHDRYHAACNGRNFEAQRAQQRDYFVGCKPELAVAAFVHVPSGVDARIYEVGDFDMIGCVVQNAGYEPWRHRGALG